MNPAAKEPEPKRGPNVRVKPFGYFGAFAKVTRRQGGTLSGRYRSNGYSLTPNPGQAKANTSTKRPAINPSASSASSTIAPMRMKSWVIPS